MSLILVTCLTNLALMSVQGEIYAVLHYKTYHLNELKISTFNLIICFEIILPLFAACVCLC